jgi:hypothetical protein
VKKLQYELFCNLYSLYKGKLADAMAAGDMRSTYTLFIRRSDGKKPLLWQRFKYDIDVKVNRNEIGWKTEGKFGWLRKRTG